MAEKRWFGAGIIPIAIYNDKLYILLGREAKGRDKGKYDAFGGGPNKEDKTPRDTALREGYEESMGFFGTKSYIDKSMKLLMPDLATDFILKIDYTPDTPRLFNNVYRYMKKGCVRIRKGYLEKDQLRWFPVNKKQSIYNFRYYFKKMYKYLVENHDEVLKRIRE
jgi:hypothetical protein